MRFIRVFIVSAASLLLSAAVAKVVSAFGHAKILAVDDEILMLPNRYVFLLSAGIEFVVALVCLTSHRTSAVKAGLIAWLATCLLVYRVGLVLIVYQKPCSCLGNLVDSLHISPQTADTAMKIVLAYLFVGSYAALFWIWRLRRDGASAIFSLGKPFLDT